MQVGDLASAVAGVTRGFTGRVAPVLRAVPAGVAVSPAAIRRRVRPQLAIGETNSRTGCRRVRRRSRPALAGLVLDVEGDFRHDVSEVLAGTALGIAYVGPTLNGGRCFNPLGSDLDAYSLALLLNELWTKGKDPS